MDESDKPWLHNMKNEAGFDQAVNKAEEVFLHFDVSPPYSGTRPS